MIFILGMLTGAAAVVLGAVIYAVCQFSEVEQYRPRVGRVDFTGVPVRLIEKYFEDEKDGEVK